jgi:hypothetical protein
MFFMLLTIVQSQLGSTMTQDRPEALKLASVENDILQNLDGDEIVLSFAMQPD